VADGVVDARREGGRQAVAVIEGDLQELDAAEVGPVPVRGDILASGSSRNHDQMP
jgi:hypothetical protein